MTAPADLLPLAVGARSAARARLKMLSQERSGPFGKIAAMPSYGKRT